MFFPELRAPFEGRWPKVDVVDREDAIAVRAEFPGVTKDDLDITLADNVLTIKAKIRQEKEEKDDKNNYYCKEISRGEFQRTLSLPCEIKSEETKAVFKDGILDLTLPKQAPAKRKTITVK